MTTPAGPGSPLPPEVVQAAVHGSFCPKMCTFACPVTAATGREDAVPWSFHRTVADLASGRLPADERTAARLVACSGCHACRVPCVFDQDVPDQVRAGRAALHESGVVPDPVRAAVTRAAAGTSPFGASGRDAAQVDAGAQDREPSTAPVALVTGCRDAQSTAAAAIRLLRAAGLDVRHVAPHGCCGAVLADLGATAAAAERGADLAGPLDGVSAVVTTDPHCLPAVRASSGEGVAVEHVVVVLDRLLADGALALRPVLGPVVWHDPCVLVRDEGVHEEPRRLLAAAGATLVEPESTGVHTACSGGGLGLPLLDPDAAARTAQRRRRQLRAAGVTAVTACAGAAGMLSTTDHDVRDLVVVLADAIDEASL